MEKKVDEFQLFFSFQKNKIKKNGGKVRNVIYY